MGHHSRGLLFLVGALVLPLTVVYFSAGQAQEVEPRGERPLAEEYLVVGPPTVELLVADSTRIDLKASLGGILAEDVIIEGQPYTRLFGEGYGQAGKEGLPGLPALVREVEIPWGARASLEVVDASYQEFTLAELGLSTLLPLQPPVVKLPGAAESQPFIIDREFYQQSGFFPASPVQGGEVYTVRGRRIQSVQVWPAAYDPAKGVLRLYSGLTLRINLDGGDPSATRRQAARYASQTFDVSLSASVLNFSQGETKAQSASALPEGYLIITADIYHDALQPFVQLQTRRGYAVTVTKLSEIPGGASRDQIKAYIQTAYNTWTTPPSYLLLVGDTNIIPAWNSATATGKYTDLYYSTMDGSSDWHPDLRRGRFPVRSLEQLNNIVNKYLNYYQLTGQEAWLKKIAFIATCDTAYFSTAEGTHNSVVSAYTAPLGYTGIFPGSPQPGGDKIYCKTYSGTAANITNAANGGRWALVYSGHGSETAWADGAITFNQTQVRSLSDQGFFPFVASHACVTGSFNVDESFAETWVLQPNKGALVVWAASHNTYWGPDDVLERRTWDLQFTQSPHPTVGDITDYGLSQVEAAYASSARYYWEAYNLMGDPSVRVFLEPEPVSFTLDLAPASVEVCDTGARASTAILGSLNGYSQTVSLQHSLLPVGVSLSFNPASAPAPFTSTINLSVGASAPVGDHLLTITASEQEELAISRTLNLRVVESAPTGPTLQAPLDGAQNQPLLPAFTWEATPLTTAYAFQLSRSALFDSLVVSSPSLPSNTFTAGAALAQGKCYWWRAQGANLCGASQWASPFHFATYALKTGFSDNMEAGPEKWTTQAVVGANQWAITSAFSHSPSNAWFVPDAGQVTDSHLRMASPVTPGPGSTLSFWHRYEFEGTSWDGSVLEISTDNGSTWSDLGPYFIANGYNGAISSAYNNPLGGRTAWTGDLTTWTKVEVNLEPFSGQPVLIRWRLGCDSSTADTGWYIDDVTITVPKAPLPAPVLNSVSPEEGPVNIPYTLQISGANFAGLPNVRLGDTWLPTTRLSSTLVQAVVPARMSPGLYDLALYNDDCQEAYLPGAYTVLDKYAPEVFYTSSSPAWHGEPLYFTATLTGTAPVEFTWDFGGPGSGVGLDTLTPAYTYDAIGTYTVTLAAENIFAQIDYAAPVAVLDPVPNGDFSLWEWKVVDYPVHFKANFTGKPPLAYAWSFGGPGIASGADTAAPVFTYSQPGRYTVTLTVTGPAGQKTVSREVEIDPFFFNYLPLIAR